MTTRCHDQSMPDKGNFAAVVQAYRWQNDRDGLVPDDVVALRASGGSSGFHEMNHPIVAQAFRKSKRAQTETDDETWVDDGIANTLNGFDTGDTRTTHAVAFTQNQREEVRELGPVTGALSGQGTHQTTYVAHAFYSTGGTHGLENTPERSPPLKVGSGLGIPSPPAVAHTLRGQGFDASEDGTGRGTPIVAVDVYNHVETGDVCATLSTQSGTASGTGPKAMTGMVVRRLTPVECERLQGFPDGWTEIPYRGKPAPDGPRYKALGNSMAVPVMRWIGQRIAAVELLH